MYCKSQTNSSPNQQLHNLPLLLFEDSPLLTAVVCNLGQTSEILGGLFWKITNIWNSLLTVVLEETPESPLSCKEIQPVHPTGDQSWVFFGRNDAKAETPVLWPPHVKSWLTGKDSDAGRGWGQEEKGMTEDEMAGWHHRLDGCEFAWTLGVGDEQGGLVCCDSWGRRESDTTEWLNWTDGPTKL